MIAFKHPEPFENKILFCDIIGYSRMPPLEQSAALRTLNAAVEGVLKDIDAALENSVIALPTGDGMALNFNTSDPIVHLRAALRLLELLEEQARNFGIRIGLNSDVDNCVIDINGKRNVVGNGINTAQRIMDLGGDGQVLMNAKLLPVLQNYGDFRHHAKHVGLFLVKHGVMIEIAQYADPNLSFVSCEPVAAEKRKPTRRSFADLVRARSHGGIIGLDLNPDAASGLEIVENHIVSTLSDVPDLASLSIVTGWIAREMLDNAFRYGRVGEFEPITDRKSVV